jgi:hypothetical protein
VLFSLQLKSTNVLFITPGIEMPVQERLQSVIAKHQAPLRRLYKDEPHNAVTRKTARTSAASIPANDPFHGEVEIGDGYGTFVRFGLDRYVGTDRRRLNALVASAERVCVNLDTLRSGVEVTTTTEVVAS